MPYDVYVESQMLMSGGMEHEPMFYSLIMAAMRKADSDNLLRLQNAWPKVWEDYKARRAAPGGFLSREEAQSIGGFSDEEVAKVKFPMEGWPKGGY